MFELIIVVVLLGAVKIYVAAMQTAMQTLRKRERQDETQFCEFQPPLNANVLFLQVFFKISPK
jgi:hypothetical protein